MDNFRDCAAVRDNSLPAPGHSASRVDLWQFSLDRSDASPAELWALLSPDEVMRAQRFHFIQDRDRFILCRGSLRTILGGYLDLPPERIEFCYGKAGKPYLSNEMNSPGLRFNISHSGGLALAAVAWDRELGVDIEQIRPNVNFSEIARQFFSRREAAEIFGLPVDRQPAAFFNCWTRKEAYLKATAEGLSFPLHSFGVSVKTGDPARLTFVDGLAAELERWTLRDISPNENYSAALAVEGAGWEICFRSSIGRACGRIDP